MQKGIYRHTKTGNLYRVFGIGRNADNGEEVVLYRALYGEGELWVRAKNEFFEEIEHEGEVKPRFTLENPRNFGNEIQHAVLDFHEARSWNQLMPPDLAKSIIVEAAELLECFQWVHPTSEEVQADEAWRTKIEKEIADVLIYTSALCTRLDIDLEEAVRAKLEHNNKKFPVEKVKEDPDYWKKAKEEYRKKGIN